MRRLELQKLEAQLRNTEAVNRDIEKNIGLLQLRENILQAERDKLAREKELLEKERTEYMQAQLNLNTIQLKTRLLEESMLVAGFSEDHSPFKLSLENPYKAKASVIRKIGIQFSVPELQSETAAYHFVIQFINNEKPGKPQILLNEIAKNNVTKGKVNYEFPVQTPGKGIYILRVSDPQQPLVKTEYYFRLD